MRSMRAYSVSNVSINQSFSDQIVHRVGSVRVEQNSLIEKFIVGVNTCSQFYNIELYCYYY